MQFQMYGREEITEADRSKLLSILRGGRYHPHLAKLVAQVLDDEDVDVSGFELHCVYEDMERFSECELVEEEFDVVVVDCIHMLLGYIDEIRW